MVRGPYHGGALRVNPFSPHSLRLALRAAASTLLLALAALAVMSQTDEPTSGWTERLVRLGALAPALGAVASALAASRLERRGEALALALAGASPLRQALPLALGAGLVGVAAALAVAALAPSLGALLPVVAASPWRPDGGGFAAPSLGLWLDAPGGAVRFGPALAAPAPLAPRAAVAASLALASLIAPCWAALPSPRAERVAAGALSLLGAVVAFHAVAAGHAAAWLLAPPLLLGAHLARLARRPFGGLCAWCLQGRARALHP